VIAGAGNTRRSVRLGRVPALVATLLSPVALYFISRTAAAGSGSPAAVAMLAATPPADYRAVVKAAARAAQSPLMKAGPEMIQLSRQAAAAAPTSFEPFFLAAKAEEQAGRLDRAIMLMEESRKRRPSHSATRLELILLYGKARRFGPLLEELDMALSLNDDARRLLLPELSRLVADPEGRAALAGILARRPSWRDEFFSAARGRKVKPADALALMNMVSGITGRPATAERGLYLQALLEAGEYARARALWSSSLPAPDRAKDGLVFDGAFAGSAAPAPFNWVLYDGDVGRAERNAEGGRGGLDITYFGGRDFNLAEQTLALAPGRYRLSFLVRSEEGIKSGDLSWRIACVAGGKELVASSLAGAGSTAAPRRADFVVPAGCGGQRLYLAGEPGDVSAEVHAQVLSMTVARND
jgi:tetratricopeptide (TPR) repeat protein